MRILVDTDVILDYVLERQPFHSDAEKIILGIAKKDFAGYFSSITPINVYYTGRKLKGRQSTIKSLKRLLNLFEVCVADKTVLQTAFTSNFKDYEDAVQHECAVKENLDAIITRNTKDYKSSTIDVYSPEMFLEILQSK